jgi:hypothetical protein
MESIRRFINRGISKHGRGEFFARALIYLAGAALFIIGIFWVAVSVDRANRFDSEIRTARERIAEEDFAQARATLMLAKEIDPGRLDEVNYEMRVIKFVISDIAASKVAYKKARSLDARNVEAAALRYYKQVSNRLFDIDEKAKVRIKAIEKRMVSSAVNQAKAKANRNDFKGAILILEKTKGVVKRNSWLEATLTKYQEELPRYELKVALSKMRSNYDQFKDLTVYKDFSSPIYINKNGFFLYFVESNGSKDLYLKMQYHDDDWLFIKRAQVIADGERIDLSETSFERDNNSMIWEWQSVMVFDSDSNGLILGRNDIEKIANAKSAVVRYTGSDYYDERLISTTEKKAMLRVLAAYDKLP